MATFLTLSRWVFAALASMVFRPDTGLIVLVVLGLVYTQYRRVAATEVELYGLAKNAPLSQAWEAVMHGVLGGVLGSFMAVWGGISLVIPPDAPSPVLYLWPVALVLSLVHPRLICFAYATTLIGLGHLLTGWPRVDVPSLVGLVGVLHLVEAFLIRMGGAACATPVVFGNGQQEPVPGFQLQRYWPVPLVFPFLIAASGAASGSALAMPDWWPLVRPDTLLFPGGLDQAAYFLVPVVVVMGYGDLAVTAPPAERARRAAGQLLRYSLLLLALAVLSRFWRPLLWVAVLYSAVGHEWLIQRSVRSQLGGVPFLQRPRRGVGVLDVLPGSFAAAAGLRSGSVVLEVSGREVFSRSDLHEALVEAPSYLRLVYKNGWQLESSRIARPEGGLMSFGAILLPEPGDPALVAVGGSLLGRWFKRGRRRRQS